MTLSNILTTLIVWFHIISHGAILLFDYTQIVPLLDFVTRADGSASDPNNLLPLELIYAGITAMSFGTIAVAFLFAVLGLGPVKFAAAQSVVFHGLWAYHMWWRWDEWRAMMHPDGELQPEFFLFGHCLWLVLSGLVVVWSSPQQPAAVQPGSTSGPAGTTRKRKDL